MQPIPQINILELTGIYSQLQRRGVEYGYGAKAEGGRHPDTGRKWNPRSTGKLSTPVSTIDNIDCSGIWRYSIFQATNGFTVPDGSQKQREWCEAMAKIAGSGVREIKNHSKGDGTYRPSQLNYRDAARYMTNLRLYGCFIRPGFYGCGDVGHVFWLLNVDADIDAETWESYGGHGVGSRPWNQGVLLREIYSVFEFTNVIRPKS